MPDVPLVVQVTRSAQGTIGLGLLTGAGGLATLVPAIGDVAGAIFGLGAIAWFIAVGLSMALTTPKTIGVPRFEASVQP